MKLSSCVIFHLSLTQLQTAEVQFVARGERRLCEADHGAWAGSVQESHQPPRP